MELTNKETSEVGLNFGLNISPQREENTKCVVCSRDLSHMNLQRRNQHISRCANNLDKNNEDNTSKDVFFCPICRKSFTTTRDRLLHLKQCGRKLPSASLLAATELEDRHAHERKALGLPIQQNVKNVASSKSKAKPQNRLLPKTAGDAELQMALALSASLQTKDSTASLNTVQLKSLKKLKTNKRKLEHSALMTQSEEMRQLLMEQRVTELLTYEETLVARDIRNENCQSKCPLWLMAQDSTEVKEDNRANFYLNSELEGRIEHSTVQAGSKLRHVSQITGRDNFSTQKMVMKSSPYFDESIKIEEGGFCNSSYEQVSNFAWDFSHLVFQKQFSDAELVAEKNKFPVHLAIISARSPKLLQDISSSNEHSLEVEGVSANALGTFIRFIYTGYLLPGCASEIYSLAQRYNLLDLEALLESHREKTCMTNFGTYNDEYDLKEQDELNEELLTLSQCLLSQEEYSDNHLPESRRKEKSPKLEQDLVKPEKEGNINKVNELLEDNQPLPQPLEELINMDGLSDEITNEDRISPDIFEGSYITNHSISPVELSESSNSIKCKSVLDNSCETKRLRTDDITQIHPKKRRLNYALSPENNSCNVEMQESGSFCESIKNLGGSEQIYHKELYESDTSGRLELCSDSESQECEKTLIDNKFKSSYDLDKTMPLEYAFSFKKEYDFHSDDSSNTEPKHHMSPTPIDTIFIDDDDHEKNTSSKIPTTLDGSINSSFPITPRFCSQGDSKSVVNMVESDSEQNVEEGVSKTPGSLPVNIDLEEDLWLNTKTPEALLCCNLTFKSSNRADSNKLPKATEPILDRVTSRNNLFGRQEILMEDDSSPELPCLTSRINILTQNLPEEPKISRPSEYKHLSRKGNTQGNPAPGFSALSKRNASTQPSCSSSMPITKTPIRQRQRPWHKGNAQSMDCNVTPMPDYKAMISPYLKEALSKIGVKAMPRQKAISLLQYIYDVTHPYVEKSNENIVTDKRCQDVQADTVSSSESSSSTASYNDVLEESCLLVETEMDNDCSSDINSKIKKFIKDDSKLHEAILLYHPLPIEDLHKRLNTAGISVSLPALMNFLDEECITFTLPRKERARHKKSTNCKFRRFSKE